MKQKLYSIISILKKLADNQKNIDIHNIENEFMLQFKELFADFKKYLKDRKIN